MHVPKLKVFISSTEWQMIVWILNDQASYSSMPGPFSERLWSEWRTPHKGSGFDHGYTYSLMPRLHPPTPWKKVWWTSWSASIFFLECNYVVHLLTVVTNRTSVSFSLLTVLFLFLFRKLLWKQAGGQISSFRYITSLYDCIIQQSRIPLYLLCCRWNQCQQTAILSVIHARTNQLSLNNRLWYHAWSSECEPSSFSLGSSQCNCLV